MAGRPLPAHGHASRRTGRHSRRFVTHWLPLILWAAVITFLSSRPELPHVGPQLNTNDYLFDYIAHAAEFGLLFVLAWRAFRTSAGAWLSRQAAPMAWVVSAACAALDEAHQALVPGRMATLADWLADSAGAALAIGAVYLWFRLGMEERLQRLRGRSP
ncbi:MAG TPA: VanZ family protein [Chloroflexi bacterium]|nr:VanZ family protein [Chloroflexota bacterium]